ncbi:MAG: hypothetical protein AAFU78_12015 [Cyanobacteria bacterium J06633_2]
MISNSGPFSNYASRRLSPGSYFFHTFQRLMTLIPKVGTHPVQYHETIEPYSLVRLAYEGELTRRGVPSHETFIEACYTGRMNASKIITAAAIARMIPFDTLLCAEYRKAVNTSLLIQRLIHEHTESRED